MKTGYIRTSTGKKFFPYNPSPEQVSVEDIATGLANTCRFAGQLPQFYSVARHSIIVSNLVPVEFALDGLFHDAAEAYLGDLARPFKKGLSEYKDIEHGVHWAIAEAVGLCREIPKEVKACDQIALEEEFHFFFPEYLQEDFNVDVIWSIKSSQFYSSPHIDKYAFLARYEQILQIQ